MSFPRATVRLQFNREFTLDDALGVVDYYADLGVSHFYASPLQCSRPGSMHGYDVIDYDAIDPELGGLDALRRLVAALRARDMGLILDIVPNHMAASECNGWWYDVLARGRASRYSGYFDIDWSPADDTLLGKVLLPVLGESFEDALASMRVVDASQVQVGDRHFPLAAGSVESVLANGDPSDAIASFGDGSPAAREKLRALLDRQHYRLAHWSEAAERINWRRFFDITDLVALRMDRAEVFETVHAFVFGLYSEHLIDGVRVDHIDGVANPREYCDRLRAGFARVTSNDARVPYIVVEKILADGERLREDWGIDGTTGYEFMDDCAAVLHAAQGAPALDALWRDFDGDDPDFAACARAARREIATTSFSADVDSVVRQWIAVELAHPMEPIPAVARMRPAFVRLLEHFEPYRTYLEPGRQDARDRVTLESAVQRASADATDDESLLLQRLVFRLLDESRRGTEPTAKLVRRFQQLTPPIAAKAVEDTAFYRYGRLISRNEVGADPAQLAISIDEFHDHCATRLSSIPRTMLTTATHDHKRGEDIRARLAVLSEIADEWTQVAKRWHGANASLRVHAGNRDAPQPADEFMLYQTLVGAWPLLLDTHDCAAVSAFADRVEGWQRKALREAKRATSWITPNAPYETACSQFLRRVLDPGGPSVRQLAAFAERIAPAGALNALAQTTLRLTTPGIPDLYRGADWWDLSLVDPDNRKAVDHVARRDSLHDADIAELLAKWRNGHVKQALIARLLNWRRKHPEVFVEGDYVPLAIEGALRDHVIAFLRRSETRSLIVVATRHAAALLDSQIPRIRPDLWRGTLVRVPDGIGRCRDIVTRSDVQVRAGVLRLEDVLRAFPVAALEV